MRPTDYNESYCERVVEWGRQGKSKAWMCSQLDIARSTMQLWEKVHPEFSAAIARAVAHSQAHWEDLGQDNIKVRDFNASVWSRSMGARFPDDWRDKVAHVGGSDDDNPIRQEIALGADAFTRAIAGLAARSGEDSAAVSAD